MSLIETRTFYKPLRYPWAYDFYKKQNQMHWLPDEVPFGDDVLDWKKKLSPEEKNLITQILRFFTNGDIDVAQAYIHNYLPKFSGHPEVAMMLTSFAAMEAVHVDAYSRLIDTLGLPESEYQAFMSFKEMKDKHEYLHKTTVTDDPVADMLHEIATFSAFSEGMQLFSSFAILLSFPRRGLLRGLGQVVSWSVRDESLHCAGMIELFKTLVKENKKSWTDETRKRIYQTARDMVELEDNFIDLAFNLGDVEGITKDEVKTYIRWVADRRLLQLGLKTNFKVKKNPLEWVDQMTSSVEHANFFETRPTAYTKGSMTDNDSVNEDDIYV